MHSGGFTATFADMQSAISDALAMHGGCGSSKSKMPLLLSTDVQEIRDVIFRIMEPRFKEVSAMNRFFQDTNDSWILEYENCCVDKKNDN